MKHALYFRWMWFWCWACYRAYLALPMPDLHSTIYGRVNLWILGWAGAYAHSTLNDFHLARFFYRSDAEQAVAWEKHLAVPPADRGGAA